MSYDIFISHSSQSSDTAMAIVEKLEKEGVNCWVAPRDLDPGGDWAEGIINGIEECPLFLLVLCDHANESPQVLREVERAVSKNKPVIPLLTTKLDLSKSLEYFVSSHHWLEFSTPPSTQNLKDLARIICKKLEKKLPDEDSSTDEPLVSKSPLYKNGTLLSLLLAVVLIGGFVAYTRLPTPEPPVQVTRTTPPATAETHPAGHDETAATADKPATVAADNDQSETTGSVADSKAAAQPAPTPAKNDWQKIEDLVAEAEFSIPITTNKRQLVIGDDVEISCTPPRSGYLTIFAHTLDTDKVTMLFPNAAHTNNFVKEGTTVQIPGTDDKFSIVADEDTGKTLLISFLHPDAGWSQDLLLLQAETRQPFLELDTHVVTRGLSVTIEKGEQWLGVGRWELQVVDE